MDSAISRMLCFQNLTIATILEVFDLSANQHNAVDLELLIYKRQNEYLFNIVCDRTGELISLFPLRGGGQRRKGRGIGRRLKKSIVDNVNDSLDDNVDDNDNDLHTGVDASAKDESSLRKILSQAQYESSDKGRATKSRYSRSEKGKKKQAKALASYTGTKKGIKALAKAKVFLFGTPQTHPGKLVFDQFSSTADPLFGRSKNFIQKITQLCIYRFRYVLCICPKYVFMQVNTMYIKALASARGSEKRKKIEKKSEKNPKKNQKNRASAYICFCRLRAKSRI